MRVHRRGREPSNDKLAPKAVVGRVSLYLRQLEVFQRQGQATVSSNQLGAALGLNDAQVRKDLAFFGQFGCPGIGYRIDELTPVLRRILGIDRTWRLALIGLGNLGRALLQYRGFRDQGFRFVALLDNDPRKTGKVYDGLPVQSIDDLASAVVTLDIRMALISVPAEAAQAVADRVVACGIQGILNFAPVALNLPPQVQIVDVDLSIHLEHLAYKVQNAHLSGNEPSAEVG